MDTSLDLLKKLQLAVDYKEQVLICCRYGYALAIKHSQVTSHLRDNHQVRESDRKGLTRYLTLIYPNEHHAQVLSLRPPYY